ncbi:MAG: ABC transporter ATP-binding protein [Zestosphaera tikiterensis]|uniref:ABC transporter ATP-binding protein n=1 Tax=Zestosphaera tikiterensis TaxID=1973259 RepID=A0A2R7Y9F5_9CREN|nr:MAG: ABC transporter ATP-binding protein [Zestosphaera tikiterensis]
MSEELLKLQEISKSFGGIRALKNVSLTISIGERLAIIGPNGAGKTTLFNVINGVYKPDTGRVFFANVDVTDLPAFKRTRMGMARAFQIPRPFPTMSVLDNVMVSALFAGKFKSVGEARERADEVLELVGLANKKHELAVNLTSPEKKLLELARALAPKPKLLLLDEIVAGIPPAEVDRIMLLVRNVSEKENIAVVALVEHVMRVLKYVERVIFLHEGRVLMDDKPEKVLSSETVKNIYLGRIYD